MGLEMKWKGGIILILIILFYLLFRPGVHYERIEIAGSTSVQPVAEKLAAEYMKKHPNVKINVQGGGSSVGIRTAQQGTADIGTSSRELKEDEKKTLKTYLIGKNCIATRGYFLEDLIENVNFADIIFLLLTGNLPSQKESKMLNAILVSLCDHSITPPSTQVARLTASTGSTLNASVAASLLAFGEKHAGAIEKAMRLFQNTIKLCETEEDIPSLAKKTIKEHLQNAKKIPGYGHRYHHKDPRAAKILKVAGKLECAGPHTQLAKELRHDDDKVDDLFDQTLEHVTISMFKDKEAINYLVNLLFIARFLERVADRAVSIADRTIFMITCEKP